MNYLNVSPKVGRDINEMWTRMLDLAPAFAFAEKECREIIKWSKVVTDREARNAALSNVITGHESQIKQLSATVAERHNEINEYAKIVVDRETQIKHLVPRLSEREREVAEYSKIVADQEVRIQQFLTIVTERDHHIATRDQQILELGKVVIRRDERIEQLTASVGEHDKLVQNLTGELRQRTRDVADLTDQHIKQVEQIKKLKCDIGDLELSLASVEGEAHGAISRANELGIQLYNATQQVVRVETSSFWRATSLLRIIWRFFENRIFGRNFAFQLAPNNEIEVLRNDYEWRSIGPDPFFNMITVDGRYPSGWVLVSTSIQRRAEEYTLKLYYDVGSGMTEMTTRVFPVTDAGEVHELTWLPRGISGMRWDPMQGKGEFTQHPIVISRIGPLGRALHRIVRVREVMRSHDTAKLRKLGITWQRLLSRPQRTYQAASPLRNYIPTTGYEMWLNAHILTDFDRMAIRRHIESLDARPLISVLMPVYNTPPDLIQAAIEFVRAQLYENWELCIADDASTSTQIKEILENYRRKDPRIKVEYRAVNGHISAASNTALALASGEFVALLDHDDMLSEQALYQAVVELNRHPDTDFVYSDEDKIDESGERSNPHFKSDWNPDLFYSQNYASHLSVYRASLVRAAGGFREGFEGSQDYDLTLRCLVAAKTARVRHIPAILYHWRATEGSTALSSDNKDYATENGIKALQEHFHSLGMEGVSVEAGRFPTTYRVRYPLPSAPPKVSLIIPTRDGCDILRACIESIQSKTTYPNYEIVVVDNQSSDKDMLAYFDELRAAGIRVLHYDEPFNYPAINNFAVERVDGAVVGLINNDIEVISPEWLTEMVSHALRPEVGAVGAKLYYSNDMIQHAGVILGIGGVAGHSHKYFPRDSAGYFSRLCVTQNLSAVTAACLLVRRDTYLKVGGMDSANLSIAFNDVDFACGCAG